MYRVGKKSYTSVVLMIPFGDFGDLSSIVFLSIFRASAKFCFLARRLMVFCIASYKRIHKYSL